MDRGRNVNMETKLFFITREGKVGRHKAHGSNLAGCGILYPDQLVIVYTKNKNNYKFNFEEIKTGTHSLTQLVMLSEDDEIAKIDIVTDPSAAPSTV